MTSSNIKYLISYYIGGHIGMNPPIGASHAGVHRVFLLLFGQTPHQAAVPSLTIGVETAPGREELPTQTTEAPPERAQLSSEASSKP